jgi:ribosome-binding factor A
MTRQRLTPESQRQRRVGEEIRHALAHIIERGHFRDPELQDVSITVTGVRMSPDLRHATVTVMRFGGGDTAALVKVLGRASAYLRGQLAHEVRLRHVPELAFAADTALDRAAELDRLFHSPAVARDLGHESDGDEDTGTPESE